MRAQLSGTPGPRPLKSKEHPHGLPHLTGKLAKQVIVADKLIETTILLAKAAHEPKYGS